MQQKLIEHIIHQIFNRLGSLLGQIEENFDKKIIHHFRVEVKKLKAFLRLARLEQGSVRIPHRLKQMYSAAGKVRDLQLHLLRIGNLNKEGPLQQGGYLRSLVNKLKKEKKELAKVLQQKWLHKSEEIITEKLPEQLTSKTLQKFFNQKAAASKAILSGGIPTDTSLHFIRKNIKEILYVSYIFQENVQIAVPALWNKTKCKKAEKMAQELGVFNDARIALYYVHPDRLKEMNAEEKKRLQPIYRQWNAEKMAIRKKLLRKLNQGLSALLS